MSIVSVLCVFVRAVMGDVSPQCGLSLLTPAWTFALSTVGGYEWGRTDMETLFGCKLELQAPVTFWDGYLGALHHNKKIAGTGEFGHLRWVVRGKHNSPKLPVLITHVRFLLPSLRMLQFRLQLRTSIKNSLCWSFGCTWNNADINAEGFFFALAQHIR